MIRPGDWQTRALFFLRWAHLISGIAWLGTLLAFLLTVEATLPTVDESTRTQVRAHLLPRLLFWMRWSALAAVSAGIADYVLLLSAEGIAPRLFVFMAAWLFGWAVVASLLWLSASGKALADGRWLGAVVVPFLAVLGWSGDLYMRRGGSHKLSFLGWRPCAPDVRKHVVFPDSGQGGKPAGVARRSAQRVADSNRPLPDGLGEPLPAVPIGRRVLSYQ